MAAVAVPDFLKQLALFLYMQLLGAIQALKEQTVDRHRPLKRELLPGYKLLLLSTALFG